MVALSSLPVTFLEQCGPEREHRFVRNSWILDVEVEMHLLGSPIRPVGWHMVGRQLHTDMPLARGIEDAVKPVVAKDVAVENPGPECALGLHIGGVEHDDPTHHVHGRNVASTEFV